ncbi:AMP-binding protein [Bremerella sp. T1]|uniref:AMP-binding protein n=1 Tax=Bremerella sp. TYQ1 TaxID=3119568 RepID=UPI001CCF1C18|nr:AMP-binding protein [Bremerella volcania]UBM36249.1 AMP-binding protein [Bremerella volcania]
MGKWIQSLLYFCLRRLLHRRYQVEVKGLEKLEALDGPILVWPNHPAYVDPPIVLSHLRFGKSLRPLVFTDTYRSWLFYPIMKIIDAYEVPNLQSHSRDAHAKTTELIDQVAGELKQGQNFLIYPSGRLQRQGYEVVGGTRIAYELLERVENVNVVLVRTRGLWGSRFGCAQEGDVPTLGKNALASLMWIIAGLVFFLPKRKVTLEVVPLDRDSLPMESKSALNRHLESFYNADGGETARYVPYSHLFGPSDFDFDAVKTQVDVDVSEIPDQVIRDVYEILEHRLDRPLDENEKSPGTTLDLIGLDSLERMDLALELERHFGFRSDHVPASIGELCLLAAGKASVDEKPLEVPENWDDTRKADSDHPEVLAETVAEAFVRRALKSANNPAVADQLSGCLNYRKLLIGATLLSKRISKLEGDSVGIMLPASVAADSALLASLIAGKLPVMLNWTTGPAGLKHATKKLEVKRVITSRRFLDRLGVELEGVEMFYLEDVREEISTFEKLKTLAATYIAPNAFLKGLPQPNVDDPAVVLFTSGSESLPKAVPLSHRNLIANIRGGIDHMDFHRSDTLLGFLPPFHSFGLTATALMPLLTGIRVVHHADPTDSRMLARVIAAYKPTLMFATPTFLQYIVSSSEPGELESLRLVLVGAEKCPTALYEQTMKILPDLALLEGYGITECSPVVSGNRPGRNKPGTIGLPIGCVDTLVVHPESFEPLPQGETGLLLIRGDSVFSGYYKHDKPQPFIEVNSHQWYNSGDLVAKDKDGFIQFRGRMKRFLKIGGEMVSLPALESPLAEKFPADEEGPKVAVEGIEQEGGRCIVLFTTQEITLREANETLKSAGFQGIMRLDEVRQVEAIPVLGTGKTNYRELRNWIQDSSEVTSKP